MGLMTGFFRRSLQLGSSMAMNHRFQPPPREAKVGRRQYRDPLGGPISLMRCWLPSNVRLKNADRISRFLVNPWTLSG